MATAPLIPRQIETVFQTLTIAVLNANDVFITFGPQQVRIGWQTQGQPSAALDQDVVYVRCALDNDRFGKVRDVRYAPKDSESVIKVLKYTRVWKCFWVLEGPNSFDLARQIHSYLLNDQVTHDTLAQANLYLVTDIDMPVRVPEPRPGDLWGERVDFEAKFNEAVVETSIIPTVASTEVIASDNSGQIFDITVES